MQSFSSQKDFEKYFSKGGGGSAFMINQSQWKTIIKQEAERLKELIKINIDYYYRAHPVNVVYDRTYGLINSVQVGTAINDNGGVSIDIYFDDQCIHPSVMKNGEPGVTSTLINYGWSWANQRPRFDHFAGWDFVGDAVEDWLKGNKYGFTVTIDAKYQGQVIDYREFM